jgi:anti-sigma factor RsiW
VECQQVRVELAAYALGGLEPSDREAVEEHLADCPSCLAEHGSYVGLVRLMERVQVWEVAPDVPSADYGPD